MYLNRLYFQEFVQKFTIAQWALCPWPDIVLVFGLISLHTFLSMSGVTEATVPLPRIKFCET
jgi:hypothetical protein